MFPKLDKFEIFDQYNGLTSLEKGNFATFLNRCFYGEERTLFLGQISLKRNDKEILNFSSKPWTNPFGKMQNFRLFKIGVFMIKNS